MNEWAKLSELKAGDEVRVTGFTCLNDTVPWCESCRYYYEVDAPNMNREEV